MLRWHFCYLAAQEFRPRASFINRKIIDDRLHRKWQGMLKFALGLQHDLLKARLCRGFAGGCEDKSHSAAGHSTKHPEAEKIAAEILPGGPHLS